jgi:two-component system, cell cycle sensor histidine kinase PleC
VNITTPMSGQAKSASAIDRDAQLLAISAPAMLVDARARSILAANPAARAILGLAKDRPLVLPPSMPAWVSIGSFAAAGPAPRTCRETLLFWTPDGPTALATELAIVPLDSSMAVLVIMFPTAKPQSGAECDDRERTQDLATLREIARRIREGTGTMPAATGAKSENAAALPASAQSAWRPRLDFRPAALPPPLPSESPVSPDALARLIHELRTPLSAIASLAEIMRDERLGTMGNERYKSYAADIHDSAQHTLGLITAMLDSNHMAPAATRSAEPGTQPTPIATLDRVDINEIGRSCVSSMQPIAARGRVTLVLDAAEAMPLVLADRLTVRQIMFNLLSNALRFTPPAGLITMTTSQLTSGGVEIAVADTGTGMRPVDIARTRSSQGGTPGLGRLRIAGEHGGSGIGLPLVRELIEAHGGALAIQSSPGAGTRVSVVFPADRVLRP